MKLGGIFDLDTKEEEIINLEKEMLIDGFWQDKAKADQVISRLNSLRGIVGPVKEVSKKIGDNLETITELLDNDDYEIVSLISEEYSKLKEEVDALQLSTYLDNEYDSNDCILEIHAGAGGTESCDWVNMLYRMYLRYLKRVGYTVLELDSQPGDEVGLKSVSLQVKGINAYGYLRGEKGVHRLVRISPFDSNKRRHTSFASVLVTPEISKEIDVVVNEKDLKIDIYRSSGPGGQGVNTTDSAVRVTHLPTGIVVTCQNERSQIQNKEHCLEILKSKLYTLEQEKKDQELSSLKGSNSVNGFGSGKRSYVMCPYTLVKDNESMYECSDVNKVLDGEIDDFIKEGLRSRR